MSAKGPIKNIAGQRFGRLLVIGFSGTSWRHEAMWLCVCDCGTVLVIGGIGLRSRKTKSCGCLRREVLTATILKATAKHGHTRNYAQTSEYRAWRDAKSRCFNPKTIGYQNYGGRGITMCDRWRDNFEFFLADVGPRPHGLTLDRINNDGNYEPGNCRWATRKEQRKNQRPARRKKVVLGKDLL